MSPLAFNVTLVSAPAIKTSNRTSSNTKPFYTPKKIKEALSVVQSPLSGSKIDSHLEAYSLLLHVAITTRSLELGKALHGHLLFHPHLFHIAALTSKLITLYSLSGQISDARRLFDDSLSDDAHDLWVAMLIAYSKNSRARETLLFYCQMCTNLMEQGGDFAFSSALKACCDLMDLRFGRAVHAQILKRSTEGADQVVNNALLRLYAECGSMEDARRMFDAMPEKNVVSWNTLLDAYSRRHQFAECLQLFRKMQHDNVGFSWVTLTTVLSVCERVSALQTGKEIHAQVVKSKQGADVSLQNSLMDLYGKCGVVELSQRVFDSMNRRDLTSWNAMITGYGIHGYATEALNLFHEMVTQGIRPDGVTFVAMLSACSRSGFTAEGRELFDRMDRDFLVQPMVEHYACLVDLLGRAGRIEEALDVVESMPMSPSGSIWGSLLNSCRLYNNVELGEIVANRLFLLEPNNAGNYVMLSNMFAKAGRWEDAKKVREMMEKRGIKKSVGCSWLQVGNRVHSFVAGGSTVFRNSPEYKRVWTELEEALAEAGHVTDTGAVLHDVDEDVKAMWVCGHSERLALVFGLLHTGEGMPIRIIKNLRVCVDCHAVMKIISGATKRLIVLRDTNRFHHFKDGTCSCKDYW